MSPSQSARFLSGAYGFDGAGNVEKTGGAYFVYDEVSRLVDGHLALGATGGGAQVWQTYAFDAFGNMQSITTNGTTRNTPTSAATNRLTSGSYDTAGNRTTLVTRFEGKRLNSPNDLVIDSAGRIWFTDPRYGEDHADRELDHDSVYRITRPRTVRASGTSSA